MHSIFVLLITIPFALAIPEPSIDNQPACISGKLDLVLVIDVSGSQERKFLTNRDAALELARSLPIGWDRTIVAVVQYSNIAWTKLEFGSSQNIDVVNDSISTLEWTGGVALGADAMDLAMIQFRRSRLDASRAIVLFNDGNSLNSWGEVLAAAERLRYSKAKIFAVSLANSPYEPELRQYVGANGTIIRSQSEFAQLKRELLEYTVPSCSRGSVPNHVEPERKRPDHKAATKPLPPSASPPSGFPKKATTTPNPIDLITEPPVIDQNGGQ